MRIFYTYFYPFIYWVIGRIFLFVMRAEISGLENLPETGAIISVNHSHFTDPLFIKFAVPRKYPLRLMGKAELFATPIGNKFFRMLGGFPVNRDGVDVQAVKTSIQILKNNENLLIFPEGSRVKNGVTLHDGKPPRAHAGAAMIAVRTGAVIVPTYVESTKKFLKKTRVIFGKPIVPQVQSRRGSAEEFQEIADEVLRRTYALGGEKVGGELL